MDILVSRGDVACSGFRSLLLCCTFFLSTAVLPAFSLMINKNAIKLNLVKSSDIKMSLNKHCCVLTRVWNSVHMFPFDPCYCSHWTHKSQRHSHNHMTETASGSQRESLPVCMEALEYVCVFLCGSVFVVHHLVWLGWMLLIPQLAQSWRRWSLQMSSNGDSGLDNLYICLVEYNWKSLQKVWSF